MNITTELERLALLGDRQAQQQCTEKGIVLPCPFCGGKAEILSNTSFIHGTFFSIRCKKLCVVTCEMLSKDCALLRWNTRPAPPIGRCGGCKHRTPYETNKDRVCKRLGIFIDRDFYCKYFEPKEEK